MGSFSMKCRASCTAGWAVFHGILRMWKSIISNK
jgi:hypothetical protein